MIAAGRMSSRADITRALEPAAERVLTAAEYGGLEPMGDARALPDGVRRVAVDLGDGAVMIRAYDPATATLELRAASLIDTTTGRSLVPSWTPGAPELVPGRGTPTFVRRTLETMRALDVPYGGLQRIVVPDLVEAEACIQMHYLRSIGQTSEAALEATGLARRVRTLAAQSGHRIT